MEITRRNFIGMSGLAAAGAAAFGLAGCAPKSSSSSSASSASSKSTSSAPSVDYASKVTETRDADIVVVGAGMSGLAAAVEGLLDGADVLVLESQDQPGGNGTVTSCVMGVGTPEQEALGITVTPAQIIATEMNTFNDAVDGSRWARLVKNSAANIAWLQEQGCTFETVDNYLGMGAVSTAHEWTADDGRNGGTKYITPMSARVEELGGEILTKTAGKQLIMADDGSVAGIYATTNDGVLQVNAKAVIIATGGYANNNDLLAEKGYDTDAIEVFGIPGHNGDGITMALEAGAKSWMDNSSLMEYTMNPAIGRDSGSISHMADAIWVNGDGERFVDENCGKAVPARPALAVRTQDISYALFTQSQLDALATRNEKIAGIVSDAVQAGSIYQADTIEELAKAAGIDPDALTETVNTYNTFAANGSDDEFGKDASCLQAIDQGPFYLNQNNGIYFLTTIGGIDTTKNTEVRAEDGGVIPGLYAVGVDGVENYKGLYTIDIPGSCNANNINSGRTAAQKAIEYMA